MESEHTNETDFNYGYSSRVQPATEITPDQPTSMAVYQEPLNPNTSERTGSWHQPVESDFSQTVIKSELPDAEAVHAAVKAEIEAKMDSSLVKTEPKYSRSRSRSGSRSGSRSTRKSRSSRSKSRDRRRRRSRSRHRRRTRSRSRSRGRRAGSRDKYGRVKRQGASKSTSRSRSRTRSRSRSRGHGERRGSRDGDRRSRRRRSPDKTQQMMLIRREVEAMYDNAMQAMIRKKEEEYAQLQALVVGATGFVTGGEANASAGYTPVLPIQPATSGWRSEPSRPSMAAMRDSASSAVANVVASMPPLPGLPTLGELGLDKRHGIYNILLELKNRFFPVVELSEIPEHVATFVTSAEGSRFIQDNLDRATLADKELIFKKILPKTVWLSMNVFGNYVIQKYFECGTPMQIHILFQKILPDTRKLTLNKYGSRVVQTALSYISKEQHQQWAQEINKDVVAFCRDGNANHVIQKIMETAEDLRAPHIQLMLYRINDVALTLCSDRFGCRVLQKVIQVFGDDQRKQCKAAVLQMMTEMTTSPFGNYVIQDLMEYGNPDDRNRVFQECLGNVLKMSRNKFASNIIEHVLKKGTTEEKIQVVREICDVESLDTMMKDQFGNYVAQRMIECSEVDVLQVIHSKMLHVIHDVTPSVDDKMRKNLEVNLQKPNIVELAKVYCQNIEAFEYVRHKHADILPKMDQWLSDISQHCAVNIENHEVSRLTEILADINGTNENGDLDSMRQDLRSYLKCLVQDYCKKAATFHVKVSNTKEMLESQGITFNPMIGTVMQGLQPVETTGGEQGGPGYSSGGPGYSSGGAGYSSGVPGYNQAAYQTGGYSDRGFGGGGYRGRGYNRGGGHGGSGGSGGMYHKRQERDGYDQNGSGYY